MTFLLLTPFLIQALLMAIDEGHFHRRRGLPRWERLGHPLDTLTVIACQAFCVLRAPDSPHALGVFIALAVFSSLFVTKDELVHSKLCSPGENWLHAVLFVVHPVVLACFAMLWRQTGHQHLLQLQLGLTVVVAVFQTLYWSPMWNRKPFISAR